LFNPPFFLSFNILFFLFYLIFFISFFLPLHYIAFLTFSTVLNLELFGLLVLFKSNFNHFLIHCIYSFLSSYLSWFTERSFFHDVI
jgi:hypothetical protein